MRYGSDSNNGLLLSVISFACQEFHWSLEYVYDASMLSLLLLMRQKFASEGREGITLSQKEAFKNKTWDDLVKESHQKFDHNAVRY